MRWTKIIIFVCFFSMLNISAQNKLASHSFSNGCITIITGNAHIQASVGQPLTGLTKNSNNSINIGFWSLIKDHTTEINEDLFGTLPNDYEIFQNYPNPFNPTTIIRYGLPRESSVKIIIYNVLGEVVARLINEVKAAGYYEIQFNANNLSSGIYIYSIRACSTDGSKDFISVKKMILIR